MIDIPLHVLEAARERADRLLPTHDQAWDNTEIAESDAIRDVMDYVIEEKRRENEAHRIKVATGS